MDGGNVSVRSGRVSRVWTLKKVPELCHAFEGQHSIWGFLGFTEEKQTFYLWTNFIETLEHFGDEKYEYANQK